MKTITEVRKAFWAYYPEFKPEYRKTYRQNDYNATIRTTFVDYVDHLRKGNVISEKLANRVTL
jgi:hypothetical protein